MADFDAFDRMTRTLRGANPLPPGSPMASMAQSLRDRPVSAPVAPVPSAYDVEAVQRAKDMATSRGAANRSTIGATNATAGAAQAGATQPSGPVLEKAPPVGGNPPGGPGGPGPAPVQPVKPTLRDRIASPGFAGVLGAASQGFNEAGNIGTGDPTRIAESTARIGAAGAGTAAGMALGTKVGAGLGALTGPLAPVAVPTLGLAGGLAGSWAGSYFGPKVADAAIETGRALTAGDTDKALAAAVGQTARDGASAKASAAQPTLRKDPLRVQEARNGIADPGRASVPMPAGPRQLRFGAESPAGTFGDGYTDMGGGIAGKSNRRDGKVNDFTNIGADGKPVAMSTMDSRTPEQIANGNRIRAETAAALTNPDDSKWTSRDNAIMAANLRDGVDPYRGTSRGATQTQAQVQGGQMYTPADIASRLNDLRSPERLAIRNGTISAGAVTRGYRDLNKQATDRMTSENALRGTKYTADQTLRGTQIKEGTERWKTQQAQLVTQRQRQLMSQIYQQSGGDPRKAQEIALSIGMDGETFGKLADANQTRSDKSRQQTRDLLAPAAIVKDKDGNDVISPARQAQVEAAVRDAYPNFESMPPAEKAAATQRVLAMENIRAAANDRKDVGLRKAIGLDVPAFGMNTLPEFTGNAEEVGWWEGATTIGAERGDLKVPTKNGVQYLNRSRLTQAELEALKANGAQLRGAN